MPKGSSDFDFSSFRDDAEPIAISVDVLLREYVDGRRRFNNVDLKECDLSYARLPLINLEEALLNKANLTGANLAGATLNHVDFSNANLTNVNLIAADLVRAKLAGAKLAGAVMSGANLSGANLRRTDLTGCSFAGANLSGVDFAGATLRDVNLGGANLKGANLSEVDLSDIDLDSLNLEETILAENVAARLWSTQTPTTFAGVAEVPSAPDETFYQDFSEPPLPDEGEDSFDDYDTVAFPLDSLEELAYADTLYASAADAEEPVAAVTDGYIPDGYMPDLDGDLADREAPAADADYQALEATVLAPDLSDGTPSVQGWAEAELPFALPEDGPSGTASNAFDSALTPEADSLAVLPPLPADGDLPFDLPPGQEPSTTAQTVAGPGFGGKSTPTFASATGAPAPVKSPGSEGRTSPQSGTDRNQPPAPTHTATPGGERSRPGRGTPLGSTAAQSKPPHSLSNQVVQSIQTALGRRVQYSLQRKLLEVYQQRCAITGCTIAPLLEPVLIFSNDRSIPDHPTQGLVLRSDLKTLYDLKLLAIHPQKLTVLLAPSLLESDYAHLQGQKIRIPEQKIYHPDAATLARHLALCKWCSPDYDQGRSQGRAVIHPGQGSTATVQKRLTFPLVLSLGLGSVALAGLIWAFTSLQRSNLMRSVPVGAPVEQLNPAADNAVHLEANGIVYKNQGIIVDGNAYLALAQAEQLGLPVADIPAADRIDQEGQSYFKVSYLRDRNIPIVWNAATRTVILDCCTETAVERINLLVGDRALESAGVIVNNTAYVPVEPLSGLNIDLSQVAPQYFLEYDGVAYLKASSLKDLAVQLEWNADTRTLALAN